VRMAVGIAGEPTCGPVLVFLACGPGREAIDSHSIGAETIVAPVFGSVEAHGVELTQGDVRVEEADVRQPALVAGPEGAHLVIVFADRRALRVALDDGGIDGPLSGALSSVLADLESQLAARAAS
jgi:hypothetical protein